MRPITSEELPDCFVLRNGQVFTRVERFHDLWKFQQLNGGKWEAFGLFGNEVMLITYEQADEVFVKEEREIK